MYRTGPAPLRRRRRTRHRPGDDRRGVGVRRRGPFQPDLRARHRGRARRPTRSSSPSVRPPTRASSTRRRPRAHPPGGIKVDPDHAAHLAPAHLGRRRRRPRPAQPHRRDRRRPARRRLDPRRADAASPPTRRCTDRVELGAPDSAGLDSDYDAIARQPVPATPTDRRDRLRRGRDRLRRAEDAWLEALRCLRCFDNVMLDPSSASCAACASTCARRTASRSPAPTTWGSAPSRRACCCSTRTSASDAGCA